jgi:hypothetical protein
MMTWMNQGMTHGHQQPHAMPCQLDCHVNKNRQFTKKKKVWSQKLVLAITEHFNSESDEI